MNTPTTKAENPQHPHTLQQQAITNFTTNLKTEPSKAAPINQQLTQNKTSSANTHKHQTQPSNNKTLTQRNFTKRKPKPNPSSSNTSPASSTTPTPTTQPLNLLWWNCGSGGISSNILALHQAITTENPEVVHLQDTKTVKEETQKIRTRLKTTFPEYLAIFNCKSRTHNAPTSHSVITLIHKSITKGMKIITSRSADTAGRLIMIRILADNADRALYTANVYFPTCGDTTNARTAMESELSKLTSTAKEEEARLAFTGDFNATTTHAQRQGYSDCTITAKTDRTFRTFIKSNALQDPSRGTKFENTHTWYSENYLKSAKLDHGLTDESDTYNNLQIRELEFAIADHFYSTATLHQDLGTRAPMLKSKTTQQQRLNLQKRNTLSAIWAAEVKAELQNTQLSDNHEEALEQAQNIALKHAIEVYGWCPPRKGKPFVSAEVNTLTKEIGLLRVIRRHLHAIIDSSPDKREHWRLTLEQKYNKLSPQNLSDKYGPKPLPIDTTNTRPQDYTLNLRDIQHATAERQKEKSKILKKMQQEQITQIAADMRKRLFQPGSRAIQKAMGKPQAETTMTGLISFHPNEITIDLNQTENQITDIKRHCNAQTHQHKVVTYLNWCWITVTRHTDLHKLLTHANNNHWKVHRIRSTNDSLSPSDRTPETETSNSLSAIEYELANNGRANCIKCQSCHQHNRPTNLCPLTTSEDENTRDTVTICRTCNKITDTITDTTQYTNPPFNEKILTNKAVPKSAKETLRGDINLPTLKCILKELKPRKAPGEDNMHPEFWKDAPDELLEILRTTINTALRNGKIPDYWRGGIVRFLLKKEPKEQLSNWRPVCLLRIAYKVYTKVINNRLRHITEKYSLLGHIQEAFRSKRSTKRQIERFTTLLSTARQKDHTILVTYVDFINAFNSCDHECITRVLSLLGIPDIDVIADLLKGSTFRSVNNLGTTANIKLTRGVKQGAIESPLIFCLFADALLSHLADSGVGLENTNKTYAQAAGFADDLVMFSASHNKRTAIAHHAELHKRLEEYSQWSNIHFNIPKCAITGKDFKQNTDLSKTLSTLTLNSKTLPTLQAHETYKYLGAHLALDGNFKKEKQLIIKRTKEAAAQLRRTVYTRDQIEKLLEICVIPIFLYTAAIVPWTPTELNTINNIWISIRKYAFKLPIQSASAPYQTGIHEGGLGHPPIEWHLLRAQHTHMEQCLLHNDELAALFIENTQQALKDIGARNPEEAQKELRTQKHKTATNNNIVLRHLELLNQIDEKMDTDIFNPRQMEPTISQILKEERTPKPTQKMPPSDQITEEWIKSAEHELLWKQAISALFKAKKTQLSELVTPDANQLREWKDLHPNIRKNLSRKQFTALSQILLPKLKSIQELINPKQQHNTARFSFKPPLPTHFRNTHFRVSTTPNHSRQPNPPRTPSRNLQPLPLPRSPQRTLSLSPRRTSHTLTTTINPQATHTLTHNKKLNTRTHKHSPLTTTFHTLANYASIIRKLKLRKSATPAQPPEPKPTHTFPQIKGTITFDYHTTEKTSTKLSDHWHESTHHGITTYTETEIRPRIITKKGKQKIIDTHRVTEETQIETSALQTLLHRRTTQLPAPSSNFKDFVSRIRTLPFRQTDNILHWSLTSQFQQIINAEHLIGVHPLAADPSFTNTHSTDTRDTTLLPSKPLPLHAAQVIYANQPHQNQERILTHIKRITANNTPAIIILKGTKDKPKILSALHKRNYSSTNIKRHTRIEMSAAAHRKGTYARSNSAQSQWTIWYPLSLQPAIEKSIKQSTGKAINTHLKSGLWDIWHANSQYGDYLNSPTTLASIDGSLSKHEEKMGGGITFREGDGPNISIGISGPLTSLTAEAGSLATLLGKTFNNQPLNILLDSLELMQVIQKFSNPETPIDLLKHANQNLLKLILARLHNRTAPTTFIKIKSHTGATLNETANTLAQEGRNKPPQDHSEDDAMKLNYIKKDPITARSVSIQSKYTSKTERDRNWKDKFISIRTANLIDKDTTTIKFMQRQNAGREHISSAIYQQNEDFDDTDSKRFLQAYIGSFPTNHKLWLMNLKDSPDCDFCPGIPEHLAHWQCSCTQFEDSRNNAHNKIWSDIAANIEKHKGKKWTFITETPMRKTMFKVAEKYRNWQPDGIIYNRSSNTLYIIEFTRCNDSRHNNNLEAIQRKDIKYDELIDSIKTHNNNWTTEQITIAIGYLGSTDQTTYAPALEKIGITIGNIYKTINSAIKTTAQAFGAMAKERIAAIHLKQTGQKIRTKKRHNKHKQNNKTTRRKKK